MKAVRLLLCSGLCCILALSRARGGDEASLQYATPEMLSAAVQAWESKADRFRLDYEVSQGRSGDIDVIGASDLSRVKEFLSSVQMTKDSIGSVAVNFGRGLVVFSSQKTFGTGDFVYTADGAGKKGTLAGRTANEETWCSIETGVTKQLLCGTAYGKGPPLGTIASGWPDAYLGFNPVSITPLAFMYWPFTGMDNLSTKLRAAKAVRIASSEPEQLRIEPCAPADGRGRVRLLLRSNEKNYKGPTGQLSDQPSHRLQRIWLCPSLGFLPMQREVLHVDSALLPPVCAVEVPPGSFSSGRARNMEEFLRLQNLDPKDYWIEGNVATQRLDAVVRASRVVASLWVLSWDTSAQGAIYPTEMVRIARATEGAGHAVITRLKVLKYEDLPDDALVEWDFPVGTVVTDERTDVRYKAGISPEMYVPEARKQVDQIRGYQRGDLALPKLSAPPVTAPSATGGAVPQEDDGGATGFVLLALGIGFGLIAGATIVWSRRRPRK